MGVGGRGRSVQITWALRFGTYVRLFRWSDMLGSDVSC